MNDLSNGNAATAAEFAQIAEDDAVSQLQSNARQRHGHDARQRYEGRGLGGPSARRDGR
jgi:hypothetical protein